MSVSGVVGIGICISLFVSINYSIVWNPNHGDVMRVRLKRWYLVFNFSDYNFGNNSGY